MGRYVVMNLTELNEESYVTGRFVATGVDGIFFYQVFVWGVFIWGLICFSRVFEITVIGVSYIFCLPTGFVVSCFFTVFTKFGHFRTNRNRSSKKYVESDGPFLFECRWNILAL